MGSIFLISDACLWVNIFKQNFLMKLNCLGCVILVLTSPIQSLWNLSRLNTHLSKLTIITILTSLPDRKSSFVLLEYVHLVPHFVLLQCAQTSGILPQR